MEKEKNREIIDQTIDLLQDKKIQEAVSVSQKLSSFRLIGILGDFPLAVIASFLSKMEKTKVADVLNQFPEEFAGEIIELMSNEYLMPIIHEMTGDELVDFIPHISEDKKKELFVSLPPKIRKEVDFLADYTEEFVGAHMEQDFLKVKKETLIQDVLTKIKEATKIEHTGYVFVVEEDNRLLGLVTLKDLMFGDKKVEVHKYIRKNLITIHPEHNALEAAHCLRTRRLKMLPVVDEYNRIIAIFTLEKAANLLSENLADDIVAFSGSTGDESFFTRPRESIKLRLPWMAANIFLNLGAVTIISSFEATIARIAILAAFLPMITDMGGNVGIQALSVSIRSLALGEAQLRDIIRALQKEIKIGLVNGLALGSLFAILSFFFQGNPVLSFVAGTALGVNVLVAGAIGGTMPFLIKKIGKDPAMMTGPVLTTITDITGVTIYLGLSTIFLIYLI